MTRNTDARPGSGWDTWHAAGYAYGQAVGELEGDALERAAIDYSDMRRLFPPSVVRRAFKEGARQGAASSHTTEEPQ